MVVGGPQKSVTQTYENLDDNIFWSIKKMGRGTKERNSKKDAVQQEEKGVKYSLKW